MHAYSELYLQNAQTNLAVMVDYAVHGAGYDLTQFYRMFLLSGVADAFGKGISRYLAGMSGVELALEVLERLGERTKKTRDWTVLTRSREYWTGWALTYYQWARGMSFYEIDEYLPVREVSEMYEPYHEMDILQFADEADRRIRARAGQTKLSGKRQTAGISQSQLSLASGVSLRTIQQYEQRQKDINRASADTLRALAGALFCRMEDLMEAV